MAIPSPCSPKRPKREPSPPPVCATCLRFPSPGFCPLPHRLHSAPSTLDVFGKESSEMNKLKPCTKFFSTSGCPFAESCHFSHYLPGGLPAFAISGFGALGAGRRRSEAGSAIGLVRANRGEYKSRLCHWFGTPGGCRYGVMCHHAHGEEELRKSASVIYNFDSRASRPLAQSTHGTEKNGSTRESAWTGVLGVQASEPIAPKMTAATAFGASSKAKISIDAKSAGAVIGKGGMNAKHICRLTGAKLSVCAHERDSKLKNIEMQGSFDQIRLAAQMVRELVLHNESSPPKSSGFPYDNYKTKMCVNFPGGTCVYGEQCRFVHADTELCEPSVT